MSKQMVATAGILVGACGIFLLGGVSLTRGLAHELGKPIGSTLGYLIGLDLRRAPPPTLPVVPSRNFSPT